MSLYDRIVLEQYPNRPWHALATGRRGASPQTGEGPPREGPPPSGVPEPMDNPLPGNMSPRAKQRAMGTRWHARRRKKSGASLSLGGGSGGRAKFFLGRGDT